MQTIAIYDDSTAISRQTSSLLSKLIGQGAKLLLGLDAFKGAIRNNTDSVRNAIANAKQTTPATLDAQLRANGINPVQYWAAMEAGIPDNADAMSADEVNAVMQNAEQGAKDPTQMVWLIGGLCMLMMLGAGGRAYSRHRSLRPSRRRPIRRRFSRRFGRRR